MATSRCPKCGSYNTGIAYLNTAGHVAQQVVAMAGLVGGALAGSLLSRHLGHKLGETIYNELEPIEILTHECHSCGHKW